MHAWLCNIITCIHTLTCMHDCVTYNIHILTYMHDCVTYMRILGYASWQARLQNTRKEKRPDCNAGHVIKNMLRWVDYIGNLLLVSTPFTHGYAHVRLLAALSADFDQEVSVFCYEHTQPRVLIPFCRYTELEKKLDVSQEHQIIAAFRAHPNAAIEIRLNEEWRHVWEPAHIFSVKQNLSEAWRHVFVQFGIGRTIHTKQCFSFPLNIFLHLTCVGFRV